MGMEKILEIVSGVTSPLLCFIFPFIIFLMAFKKALNRKNKKVKRGSLVGLVVFFVLFTIYTILMFVLDRI
jgi:lipopolysaccharide export LptBFGC system permease protein LptF